MVATKKHKNYKTISLILLALFAYAGAASAQQTNNYAFVSPNTRENLKIEDAIKGMNSAEETQLRMKAINLSCVVRSRIRAYRALGAWSDGAEHSVLLRLRSDEATLRYISSRLGRDAQQKYVIYFRPEPKGAHDLYILTLPARSRNLIALSSALEQARIPFRTLVRLGGTTAIYIIDIEAELHEKVHRAARKLRARITHQDGSALLLGDDERQKARAEFEKEIKDYETKNPNLPPTCDVQRKTRMRGH